MPLTWMASERLPTDGRGEVQSPVAGKDELAAVSTLMPTIAQSYAEGNLLAQRQVT